MNINLTPELNKMVKKKIAKGLYASASEVVRDSLRLMKERDAMQEAKLKALKSEIKLGLVDLDNGNRIDGKTAMQNLKKRITKHSNEKDGVNS